MNDAFDMAASKATHPNTLRSILPCLLAAVGGVAWLMGGPSLLGPLLSLLLPVATAASPSKRVAFVSAFIYYAIGSIPLIGIMGGRDGSTAHGAMSWLIWIITCGGWALPWALLGRFPWGRVWALLITAFPVVGPLGWLTPLDAADVAFPPGWNYYALALIGFFVGWHPLVFEAWKFPGFIGKHPVDAIKSILAVVTLCGIGYGAWRP